MLFTAQEVVTPSQAKSHQGRQASKARRDCVVIIHILIGDTLFQKVKMTC